MKLTTAISHFIESGVSTSIGTADSHGRPEVMRALGTRTNFDLSSVATYLPEALATVTLSNLRVNPRVALTASRVLDHKTLQLKGALRHVRPGTEEERERMQLYIATFAEQLYLIGLPKSLSLRVRWWPAVVVEFTVTDLFEQTPGPGTGARLSEDEVARAVR